MSKFTEYLEATSSNNNYNNTKNILNYLLTKINEISSDTKIMKELNSIKSRASKIKVTIDGKKILNKTESKEAIKKELKEWYNKIEVRVEELDTRKKLENYLGKKYIKDMFDGFNDSSYYNNTTDEEWILNGAVEYIMDDKVDPFKNDLIKLKEFYKKIGGKD